MDLRMFPHVRAAYVWRDGRLTESFGGGQEEKTLYPVGCIFKAFVAALVGIAIREGKIGAADDRVIEYYKGARRPAQWQRLTIAHALSKTSGIAWPGPGEKLPGDMKGVFGLPFSGEPGEEFMYKPDPQIAVYLLEDVYGMPIDRLFQEKLGGLLGRESYCWERERIEGMKLSVSAMYALGRLYMDKGMLNGTRLFDEAFFEESRRARSGGGFPEGMPYGLGWWLGRCGETEYMMASGFGGQILAVAPERRLIVCVVSEMDRPHPENRQIVEKAIGRQFGVTIRTKKRGSLTGEE